MSSDPVAAEALQQQLRQACAELECRLRADQPGRAADFLAAAPALAAEPNAALELIYTEFVVREQLGQKPRFEEWCARFPQWQEDLRQLFQVHRLARDAQLGASADTPTWIDPVGDRGPAAAGEGGPPPEPLRRLGDYELLGEIGRGGMGVVYRARQAALKRVVALKLILAGEHAGPEAVARFKAEAEAVARLQHPHIVQIYEVGEYDGRPFFSLEYLDGGTLEKRLAGNPLPARQAARLIELLARAVHHAHERGVVHRDLKPANILMQNAERRTQNEKPVPDSALCILHSAFCIPKVTDFGLAKLREGGPGLTPTQAILGTPSYMAPEQAAGRAREVGPPADVYALGALLYECLTGRPPFRAETALDTLQQVLSDEPVPPRRLQPKVPADLETVCLKCLEKKPARRYPSALELADDLGCFLGGQPIRARPPSVIYRLRKFAGRHKAAAAGVAAVFLALVVGVVGLAVGMTRAQAERDRARRAERKARAAERETRGLLADSFAQAGRLAMRRGAWRTALKSFDRALGAGHPDSARLRLLKVRAWCALHEVPRALRELEALAGRNDLGELAGQVLLWRADIALGQSLDDAKALGLVRRALRKGLPPAEGAYARGLLAETSPEAARHFREAVDRDPFRPRANGMLVLLLLTLGELPEARERAAVSGRLFPDDPTFPVLRAQISALEGDLAAARAALDRARGQLGSRQLAAARALAELCHQARPFAALVADPEASLLVKLLRVTPPVTRAWAALRKLGPARGQANPGLLLPIPPVLVKVAHDLSAVLPRTVFGANPDGAIAALSRAVRVHPEGMLFLALGLMLADRDRWAEAERAFRQAAETPSLIPVDRAALFAAACSEWVLADLRGPAPHKEMKARAVRHAWELVRRGEIPPGQADLLTQMAVAMREFDLARRIVTDWERQAPGRLRPLRRHLAIEMSAGAYGAAVQVADRILGQSPNDAEALRQRSAAVAGLREQLKTVGGRGKGRRGPAPPQPAGSPPNKGPILTRDKPET
jgi:tetratricopeptide (TPR) repeat protein